MVQEEEAEGKSGRKWMKVESESVQCQCQVVIVKREETVTGGYDDTIGGRSTEYVSVGVSVSHVGIGIGIIILL